MSDMAWVHFMAVSASLKSVQESQQWFADWPDTFEGYMEKYDGEAYLANARSLALARDEIYDESYEEAQLYDAWKNGLWKQAVIHAELKGRLGVESHRLNYWLNTLSSWDLRESSYEGFVPLIRTCDCCYRHCPQPYDHRELAPKMYLPYLCSGCKGHDPDDREASWQQHSSYGEAALANPEPPWKIVCAACGEAVDSLVLHIAEKHREQK